jgi:regulator of nucleoside diphosphate kinase
MLLITTDTLPKGVVMKEAFSMILTNKTIELSKKGLIRGVLERNRNEYDEALEFFVAQAPREANAIVGIQVSTSTQQFSNGVFLYMTMVGTPIIYENASE